MTLHNVRAGSGPPLLLLHSLGGSTVMWEPVMDLLAAEREVVAVDMPGFGESPPLPRGVEHSGVNLAAAVLDFYDTLEIDQDPHVAGISFGGWVSIEVARRGRARSVVGLCTAGFWQGGNDPGRGWLDRARRLGRIATPLLPLVMRSEDGRRRALGRSFEHPERLTADQASRIARAYSRSAAYPETSRLMHMGSIGPIDDLDIPVTLAWAEHDRLVRRPNSKYIPDSVNQVTLPGCGHVPTWDDPELVARVILEGTTSGPTTT